MIETRPNRIELKRLTNKYRDNYNHDHVLKIDTAQKLDFVDENLIPQQRYIIL